MSEKVIITVSLGVLGFIIGFIAQRSRMCFIGGFRDFLLVRDKDLLTGLITFIVTIWVLSSILYSTGFLHRGMPEYGEGLLRETIDYTGLSISRFREAQGSWIKWQGFTSALRGMFLYVTLAGGIVIGLVTTLAGGCVLRQHVLFAQGSKDALFFILGLYFAVLFYYGIFHRFVVRLY
jgi:uncharacterized membrane protein YedE/YeeE